MRYQKINAVTYLGFRRGRGDMYLFSGHKLECPLLPVTYLGFLKISENGSVTLIKSCKWLYTDKLLLAM